MTKINAKERLILALDVSSRNEADKLIKKLDGIVNTFKVNFRLIFGGVNLIEFIDTWVKEGKQFFVDFKHDDTNDTVSEYIKMLSEKKVKFCTIHGNSLTINAAKNGRRINGNSDLKLLFVTVLTSLDDSDLKDIFTSDKITVKNLTLLRTKQAIKHNIDGVIASGHEAKAIKQLSKGLGKELIIVSPGIRLKGNSHDDHKRVSTPEIAIENGSDYLVVGRPIYLADETVKAASEFVRKMQIAFDNRAN